MDGRIGSRACLAKQIGLVDATPDDLAKLISGVRIDPYFTAFLKKAEQLGVLVTIVSDGFDLLIEQVLKKNLETGHLKALPIFSNRLRKNGKGFEASFPEPECEHGCANCKAAVIKKTVSPGDHVLFAGDGLSDRYAAETAHVTFAKGKLLDYCRNKGLDYIAYDDFKKITEWLSDNHAVLKKATFK